MNFMFGFLKNLYRNTCILVFVDRLRKMAHLAAVPDTFIGESTATLFMYQMFRQHVLSVAIVDDRDTRCTGNFWKSIF